MNLFTRRYVGDYRPENKRNPRRRLRTIPVYWGTRFCFVATALRNRWLRLLVPALVAIAAETPLLAVNSDFMRTWFVSTPIVLGRIPLILLWAVIVRFITVKREFRREDRDLFENRFPISTLLFGILNAAAATAAGCSFSQSRKYCSFAHVPWSARSADLLCSGSGST